MEPKKTFRLLSAIRGRRLSEVVQLLEEGVDPDTKFLLSGRLRPAICIAVEGRSVEIVELLCNKGCSLSNSEDSDDNPILISCRNGDVEIVRILLKQNANVTIRDLAGKTPLHLASKGLKTSQAEIVSLLLEKKSEIDARDFDGRTALMYASHCVNVDVADALLRHGADASLSDRHGMTSLHFLAISASRSDSAPKLMNSIVGSVKTNLKSFVNKRESVSGSAALHCIIQSCGQSSSENVGLTQMVKTLIRLGADINAQNAEGRTPLHMACNMKQFECARILVSFGCKVSAFDLLGRLPIIEAARLREAATLNLLLKANGPSYSQEFLGLLQQFYDHSARDHLIETNLKNPGSLQDLSRRSLVRATICAQNLKENILPKTLKNFLLFQDCRKVYPGL